MGNKLAVILLVQLIANFIIGIVFYADEMFIRESLNFWVSEGFDIQPNTSGSSISIKLKKNQLRTGSSFCLIKGSIKVLVACSITIYKKDSKDDAK